MDKVETDFRQSRQRLSCLKNGKGVFLQPTMEFRQLYFDENMAIHQEIVTSVREMTEEEIVEYEKIVEDANQMTIFDFLGES